MNYCYGESEYFYFNYSDSNEKLFDAFCGDMSGCVATCVEDEMPASGNNSFAVEGLCREYGGIKEFSINRKFKNVSELSEKLGELRCGDVGCKDFVLNNYCKKNTDDVCKQLKGTASEPVKENGGNTKKNENSVLSCTVDIKPYFSDSSSNKKAFQISFGYSSKDGKLTPSFVNSSTIKEFTIDFSENYVSGVDNKFYFYAKGSNYDATSNKIINSIKNEKCPQMKFCLESASKISGFYTWWLEMEECDSSKYSGIEQNIGSDGTNSGSKLTGSKTDWGSKLFQNKSMLTISGCKELLGGEDSTELVDLLKNIVTVVKVLIPLILISLGTLDFAKAVFSNEDTMKKCQKKFIQRIIIAIVIFLIPSLLKVLLTLANSAWGNISSDLCGIL